MNCLSPRAQRVVQEGKGGMDPEYRTQKGGKDTRKRRSATARGQDTSGVAMGMNTGTSLMGTVGQL